MRAYPPFASLIPPRFAALLGLRPAPLVFAFGSWGLGQSPRIARLRAEAGALTANSDSKP